MSSASRPYWRLKWTDVVIPEYPTPESLPLFVTLANKLIMGTGGTPTIPLFIGQGANGIPEGTPGNKPGIGAGDGVMIAGDVRTLARNYCAQGTVVSLRPVRPAQPHLGRRVLADAGHRLDQRPFAGRPAPNNCASIPPAMRWTRFRFPSEQGRTSQPATTGRQPRPSEVRVCAPGTSADIEKEVVDPVR